MAYPIDDLTNTNLDVALDDPSQARTELNAVILKTKAMLQQTGVGASQVLKLDSNGKVPNSVQSAVTSYVPVISTGTGNAFSVNLGLTAYEVGRVYEFLADKTTAGMGSTTLDIDGVGVRSIVDLGGSSMQANQVIQNQLVKVLWTGSVFEMQNAFPASNTILYDISDTTSVVSKGQFLNVKQGSYQKIGDYVRFNGYIKVSTLGSLIQSNFLYILLTDIPFEFDNTFDLWGANVARYSNIIGSGVGGISMLGQNKFMRVYRHDAMGNSTQLTVGALQANSELQFFGEFRVRF